MQFGDTLSPKDVDKLRYLSACMKESQRVTPTVNGMTRVTPHDIEVAGYHIPAGTWCYSSFHHFAENKRYFPDSEVYRPERWIDPDERKGIHPFAVLPFSHGPREESISCAQPHSKPDSPNNILHIMQSHMLQQNKKLVT